jgi:TRAP-type C4-dicarboxylate transport system substrate-binding protein
MIEAFGTTPLFALSTQWFGLAKNMVALNWTPLNGALIVTKKQWEKIDPALRPELMKIARDEGAKLKQEVRGLDDKAIKAMKDRGLTVVEPTPEVIEQWRKVAELAYPDIRGAVVPEEYFDAVKKYAEEYRTKKAQ